MDVVARDEDIAAAAERYRRFADEEAPGRSDLYTGWGAQVAEDPALTAVVGRIPAAHRQPPLVFAVARLLGAPEVVGARWRAWMLAHADELAAACERRTVQTNEPLRCAALLPALAMIEGPIALLEVGASAGLCLYPDRYSYRYETPSGPVAIDPEAGPSAVVLHSRWDAVARPPARLPDVVWRAGVDLAPLPPDAPGTREWLTALVWPGEDGRAARIGRALDIAASDPPVLVAADAASGAITRLAAAAPAHATLVVSTPGVLVYLPRDARVAVIAEARRVGRWLTLDQPAVHDGWRRHPVVPAGACALALDGEVLASADPLGRFVEWRRGAGAPRG
ncbi:DUF2332 domain-containing protein [Microbacterium sp. SORGH_AS_0888]|uniref:DUF2332 domain-containing protein n=1 Tax=Microbacterium sp. SORGH_AS_0888 TaxID=3041791 RepID=UPI0027837E06|nr:DUF2332 domain-containing protein [Microbacterium sp. SORGH_AS_0888]MDQ1131090.1 hypothetical protein [Microbacterium sp. SORGH_AS_0888]